MANNRNENLFIGVRRSIRRKLEFEQKENISPKRKSKLEETVFRNLQSSIHNVKSKLQQNKQTDLNKINKIGKRLPLQDVAVPLCNNHNQVCKNIINKNKETTLTKPTTSRNNSLKDKARDSFPLNVSKLKPKTQDESGEIAIDSTNSNFLTFKRDYDEVKKESPYDTFYNVAATDISDYDFDEDKFQDVLHIPHQPIVGITPVTIRSPPDFVDIKAERKQCYSKLKYQEIVGVSPLVLQNEICRNKKCSEKSQTVAGTVNLDINEHIVKYEILYAPMYLDSAIRHMFKKELLNPILSTKTNLHSDINRSIIINWLVKLQACLKTEHCTLYLAVTLFDRTIHTMDIPLESLQLVALASFWIALKFYAAGKKAASDAKFMVKLTAGAYTPSELMEMELKIFKLNNYNINPIDITTFVHYYILNLSLCNADMISACSHYLLTCSYLRDVFLLLQPSHLAAGAVFTALHLMNQYSLKLWLQLGNNCYYRPEDLILIKKDLIDILKRIKDPSFPCREPYIKYSSSKHHRVSLVI